jgi:hypothetical protein
MSEGGWEDSDKGFWKSFAMSALDGLDVDAVDVVAVENSALEFDESMTLWPMWKLRFCHLHGWKT